MGFGKGAVVPGADERVANAITGAKASGAKWKSRAKNPTRNPIEAMIAGNDAWEAGVQKAVAEKSFAAGAASIDENEMVAAIDATPDGALGAGMERRKAKMLRKTKALVEEQGPDVAEVRAMPSATDSDRQARMLAMYEKNRTLKARIAARLAK